MRETNCWSELFRLISSVANTNKQDVRLYIVGPEMSTTQDLSQDVNIYQGTVKSFFRERIDLLSANTIVVGLNCGFGNWENPLPRRFDLLYEWLPDLYFLTGTKLPLIFACANDYADLAGETG